MSFLVVVSTIVGLCSGSHSLWRIFTLAGSNRHTHTCIHTNIKSYRFNASHCTNTSAECQHIMRPSAQSCTTFATILHNNSQLCENYIL